jgi:hypothetical protein
MLLKILGAVRALRVMEHARHLGDLQATRHDMQAIKGCASAYTNSG